MSDLSTNPVGKPTILLVDDEWLVRAVVADDLQERNYTVMQAASGDEAAAVLRDGSLIDLVFTDVRMPGALDGIALARLISAEFPQTKVIIASGHIPALPASLAEGFFSKPYDLASVAQKIETILKPTGQPSLTDQQGRSKALEAAN